MILKVLILAVFCGIAVSSDSGFQCDRKHLTVRFGSCDAYHKIPLNKCGLRKEGYRMMSHDKDLNVELWSYKEDPRVLFLLDSCGQVCGIRVSFIKKHLPLLAQKNNVSYVYDLSSKPMFKSAVYYGEEVFYNTGLFMNPDKLKAGYCKNSGDYVFEEIWVRPNGVWSLLPQNEGDATGADYVKEACYDGMGRHYFYTAKACLDIQGLFGLYQHEELMGMGFTSFGSFKHGPHRKWLEVVTPQEARDILTTRPDCLIEWTENFSITSLHIYFCQDPRGLRCPKEED